MPVPAVAYGLDKEQARKPPDDYCGLRFWVLTKKQDLLKWVTNIIISGGDLFDAKTSVITDAFIQGRKIDLNNKQTQTLRNVTDIAMELIKKHLQVVIYFC